MLAEFTIYPTDDTHISEDLAKVVEILEDCGVRYQLGPMGTAIEGEWEQVMAAVRQCHEATTASHDRVVTTITIDDRKHHPHHLNEMVAAVERHLGRESRGPLQDSTLEVGSS